MQQRSSRKSSGRQLTTGSSRASSERLPAPDTGASHTFLSPALDAKSSLATRGHSPLDIDPASLTGLGLAVLVVLGLRVARAVHLVAAATLPQAHLVGRPPPPPHTARRRARTTSRQARTCVEVAPNVAASRRSATGFSLAPTAVGADVPLSAPMVILGACRANALCSPRLSSFMTE